MSFQWCVLRFQPANSRIDLILTAAQEHHINASRNGDNTLKIRPWSDADVAELRTKYLEGMDDRELGMFFDRSESAIETKRSELRLIAKFYPDRPVKPKRTVGRSYHIED